MRALAALVVAFVSLIAGSAWSALPPEAYEQLRNMAPLAFAGTVQQDSGGQALVRVDHVARGNLRAGQVVTVAYPVAAGYAEPGPQVHYRPFVAGTRLRVFGQPGYDGRTVNIVHGGIDVMTPPSRPKGGCASCSVAETPKDSAGALWVLAMVGIVLLRRRRWGLAAWTAAALLACSPAPPPPPVPGPVGTVPGPAPDDGVEIATEGKSTVTVLNRPDHPSVKPPPGAKPVPRTTAECRMMQACATQGLCTASGAACVSASYEDCEQMRGCASGKCAFEAGTCKVVPDCKASHGCAQRGRCAEFSGKCVADEDGCKQSVGCKTEGRCTADNLNCVAAEDVDCTSSEACTLGGRCKADAGRCVAQSDKACKKAPACKEHGRCVARDGVCVKSCAEDELCTVHGRCGERPTHPGSCVALSDTDCDKSEMCKEMGYCSLGLNARCEAGDDVECRLSQTCKEHGRCTHQRGRCIPGSDAECKAASIACKREGRCKHDNGRCVKG